MINRHFKFTNRMALVVAVVTACGLASCATYSKVSERCPYFIPFTSGAGPLANAETGIAKAMRIDRHDPLVALGEYMSAAETALRQLKRSPNDLTARNTYNFAVGRIIATIRDAKLDPWTQPLRVPGSDGEFVLTHKPDPAHSGIQRSTILRQRISLTSVGLTSPNAPPVMASVRQLSRLDAK
jgi:hypothetical protein